MKEHLRRFGTLKSFQLPSNDHHKISRTGGLNIVHTGLQVLLLSDNRRVHFYNVVSEFFVV